jgi:hypothetical protein
MRANESRNRNSDVAKIIITIFFFHKAAWNKNPALAKQVEEIFYLAKGKSCEEKVS